MARLPKPGRDDGTWGGILNEYLSQAHGADGSLKDGAVTTTKLVDGAITNNKLRDGSIAESKLDTSTQAKLNNSVKSVNSVKPGTDGNIVITLPDKVTDLTLTANTTLDTSSWSSDYPHVVVFTQDGTGSRTVTYGGKTLKLNAAANASTSVIFTPDGDGWSESYPAHVPIETFAGVTDRESIWTPPAQPAALDGATLNTYVGLWDSLVSDYPDYVTRTSMGMDASGTYPVYRYVFEPEAPERTIILTANIHGGEDIGQQVLYRFMRHVADDYLDYPQLAYLRTRVRIVTIPIANPYGLVNGTRQNGNPNQPVDLNRNFAYQWDAWVSTSTTYKGTAPLSEVESQYIDQTLAAWPDAICYLDLHNTSSITPAENTVDFYTTISWFSPGSVDTIHRVIDHITPKGFTAIRTLGWSTFPAAANHGAMTYGLHAITLEHQPGMTYGHPAKGAEDMTDAMRWFGNMILAYSALPSPHDFTRQQPWAVEVGDNTTSFATSTTEWEAIPGASFTFSPKCGGVLDVGAAYSYQNTTEAAINYFAIAVSQPGHALLLPTTQATDLYKNEVYSEPGGKRDTVSMQRRVGVYAVDDRIGDVTVQLFAKTSIGSILGRRMRMSLTFIPSDSPGQRWQRYWAGNPDLKP